MQDFEFKTPPKVIERYKQLYDLIENKSKDGMILVKNLAEYYGCTPERLSKAILSGGVPYAFSNIQSGRAVGFVDIFPFWQYQKQNLRGGSNFEL